MLNRHVNTTFVRSKLKTFGISLNFRWENASHGPLTATREIKTFTVYFLFGVFSVRLRHCGGMVKCVQTFFECVYIWMVEEGTFYILYPVQWVQHFWTHTENGERYADVIEVTHFVYTIFIGRRMQKYIFIYCIVIFRFRMNNRMHRCTSTTVSLHFRDV